MKLILPFLENSIRPIKYVLLLLIQYPLYTYVTYVLIVNFVILLIIVNTVVFF